MRRFGFTIIELLVVLTILAIIMGLLTPVLHAGRLRARTLVCSSNIKQILNLLAVYEQQNGVFPYGFDDSQLSYSLSPSSRLPSSPSSENYLGDPTRGDKKGIWWLQCLGYKANAKTGTDRMPWFWCPSRSVKDSTKLNVLCGNYGVNRSICKDAGGIVGAVGNKFVGTPLNASKISHSGSVLLVVDSGYSLISWQGATNAKVQPSEIPRPKSFYVPGIKINSQKTLLPDNREDAIAGRHIGKTVNVGYVDGHVKRLKAEELFVLEQNEIYTNLYDTWIPR